MTGSADAVHKSKHKIGKFSYWTIGYIVAFGVLGAVAITCFLLAFRDKDDESQKSTMMILWVGGGIAAAGSFLFGLLIFWRGFRHNKKSRTKKQGEEFFVYPDIEFHSMTNGAYLHDELNNF